MPTICDVWPITWTCDVSCLSPTVTGTAVQVATDILYGMSGRQFGTCTTTLRPCRKTCNDYPYGGWDLTYPQPLLYGGKWFNTTCGLCASDSCSCMSLSEVLLPDNAVSITSVKLDGSPMVTGAYRVDNGNHLVRTDGGSWPWCQNMASPDTAAGTWSVTGVFGQAVPSAGMLAAGELACELSKALDQNKECRLPRGVTQVNRQGVQINYAKVTDALNEGNTGLYLVDLFLRTYNPGKLVAPATVYNIDAPTPRVQTWP